MKLSEIIAEADVRVPNAYTPAQKVTWLNEINNEFFDIVKIPLAFFFTAAAGTAVYPTNSGVRSKNIDLVNVGTTRYSSFQYENWMPGRNYWVLNDSSQELTLTPAPISADPGVFRYSQVPTSTFLSTDLTVSPEAPTEYHHVYISGLCEKMAKAIPDISLGNNYRLEYEAGLQIAMQNYARGAGA